MPFFGIGRGEVIRQPSLTPCRMGLDKSRGTSGSSSASGTSAALSTLVPQGVEPPCLGSIENPSKREGNCSGGGGTSPEPAPPLAMWHILKHYMEEFLEKLPSSSCHVGKGNPPNCMICSARCGLAGVVSRVLIPFQDLYRMW